MFAAVMAMAFFLFQLGIAEAGVSTLYPGAGNRPPKTPEWNVEKSRDENASAKAAEKNGGAAKGVKKLDKKNVPMKKLLAKHNYRYRGNIDLALTPDGLDLRQAFEKIL